MSDERRREVQAMIARLESDGPFDHTEGIFGNKNPGFFGTDFLGNEWRNRRIKELEEQLETENAINTSLKQQLEKERADHGGTQAQVKRLQGLVANKLRILRKSSTGAFDIVKKAFDGFIEELDREDHILQIEINK